MTNAIKKNIRGIYTKSLTPEGAGRENIPDMLNVPEAEGGRLQDEEVVVKEKKKTK